MNIYHKDSKSFLKVLFRSDFGIQSRELNAVQQHLQEQIASMGTFLFKNGSSVIGGKPSILKTRIVRISKELNGSPISETEIVGQNLLDELTGTRFTVVDISETDEYYSLHGSFVENNNFSASQLIKIEGISQFVRTSDLYIEDQSGLIARIEAGVYFYDKYFFQVEETSSIITDSSTNFTGSVGIVVDENFITPLTDRTLLDPSIGDPNENAPGAHRFTYEYKLTSYQFFEETPSNYIKIAEVASGKIRNIVEDPRLNELGRIMSEITYDQSGNFVVEPYNLTLFDNINRSVANIEPSSDPFRAIVTMNEPHFYQAGNSVNIQSDDYVGVFKIDSVTTNTVTIVLEETVGVTNTSGSIFNSSSFGVEISKGVSYVNGFKNEILGTTQFEPFRSRKTDTIEDITFSTSYGNFIEVNNLVGVPQTRQIAFIKDVTDTTIGECVIDAFTRTDATGFRLYVSRIKMTETFGNATSIEGSGSNFVAEIVENSIQDNTNLVKMFPVYNSEIKSLTEDGTSPLLLQRNRLYSLTFSSNSATLGITSPTMFLNSRNFNLVGTVEANDFTIFDSVGNILTPTSIIIDGNGTSITAQVAYSGSATLQVKVAETKMPATKTITDQTFEIAVIEFDAGDRKFFLPHVDVIDLTIIDTDSGNNVTKDYIFDNGQRDRFYDFASITLIQGALIPEAPVSVEYRYYTRSAANSFFTIDSYPDREIIDNYVSEDGSVYKTRNFVDFRTDAVSTTSIELTSGYATAPLSTAVTSVEYYLSRRDIIVIGTNGKTSYIEGTPALAPSFPKVPSNSMVLFGLVVPAYTNNAADIVIKSEQIKRYTMKDINRIDRRIDRVEEELSLSLLESEAKNQRLYDQDGTIRFNTGFIVDGFQFHGLGDTENPEYKVAVDSEEKSIRPQPVIDNVKLDVGQNRSNVSVGTNELYGTWFTRKFNPSLLTSNLDATKIIRIIPYTNRNFSGNVMINPPIDSWEQQLVVTQRIVSTVSRTRTVPGTGWNTWWKSGDASRSVVGMYNQHNQGIPSHSVDIPPGSTMYRVRNDSVNGSAVDIRTTASTESYTARSVSNQQHTIKFTRAIDADFEVTGLKPFEKFYFFLDGIRSDSIISRRPTNRSEWYDWSRKNWFGTWSYWQSGANLTTRGGNDYIGNRILRDESDTPTSFITADITGAIRGKIKLPEYTIYAGKHLVEFSTSTTNSSNAVSKAKYDLYTTRQYDTISRNTVDNRFDSIDDPDMPLLSQTFSVSEESFPNGFFLESIDLFFARKPQTSRVPVTIDVRISEYGKPSSKETIKRSVVQLNYDDIVTPADLASTDSIRQSPTHVEFPIPLYLQPGEEYSIVLRTMSVEYEIYASDIGELNTGSTERATNSVITGSVFRTPDGRAWNEYKNADLTMNINICKFDTSLDSFFELKNEINDKDVTYDLINPEIILVQPGDTSFDVDMDTISARNLSTLTYDIVNDSNNRISERGIIRADNDSDLIAKINMYTNDEWVSPIMYNQYHRVNLIKNMVNFYGLDEDGFEITNRGSAPLVNPTITVSGDQGSGAVLEAILDDGGFLVGIEVVNEGSDYITEAPTITIGADGGTDATAVYDSFEVNPRNGNAKSKYYTKPVPLREGFSTDEVAIFFDSYIPSGSSIDMYIRSLSKDDDEIIENRPWVLAGSSSGISADEIFTPQRITSDATYTYDGVFYDQISTVQAKIVLLTRNTSNPPRVKNFRMITSI